MDNLIIKWSNFGICILDCGKILIENYINRKIFEKEKKIINIYLNLIYIYFDYIYFNYFYFIFGLKYVIYNKNIKNLIYCYIL